MLWQLGLETPKLIPHVRFEAIELRQEAALVSAAWPTASASNVRMAVSVRQGSELEQDDAVAKGREPQRPGVRRVEPRIDADQFGSAAEDSQPTRSILAHRCARGVSRREGHNSLDGGGRMRSRRSRWVIESHVPIAIATRVVTCSTSPTTSSERLADE